MTKAADRVPTAGDSFINELRDFKNFVGKVWTSLYLLIFSFPLSNLLIQLIPIEKAVPIEEHGVVLSHGNGLMYLSPETFAVI